MINPLYLSPGFHDQHMIKPVSFIPPIYSPLDMEYFEVYLGYHIPSPIDALVWGSPDLLGYFDSSLFC